MKDKSVFTKLSLVIPMAFIACALWGSAAPVIKTGYRLQQIAASDTASILVYAGLRFTIAGIMVILVGSLLKKQWLLPKRQSLGKITVLSMIQTVLQYLFFYIGVAHASGVKSAIMVATNVFFSVIASVVLFRFEKLSPRKLLGIVVGFLGIVIVNLAGSGEDMHMSFVGEGFVILSSISYGISSGVIKRYSSLEDPLTLSGWQFLLGGVILSVIGFAFGGRVGHWSGGAAAVLAFLAFISAMAYSLWSILLAHNPVSRIAVFGFLNPMCGVIISAFVLNEKEQAFRPASLIALALVCLGIWIVNRGPSAAPKDSGN